MNWNTRQVLGFFFVFFYCTVCGQTDSSVSELIDSLNNRAKQFYSSSSDYTWILSQQALNLAIQDDYKFGQAVANHHIGSHHINKDQLDSALKYTEKALQIKQCIHDSSTISSTLNNLGVISYRKGNYTKALHYLHKSLKYIQAIGDSSSLAGAYLNIGGVYYEQDDFDRAVDYYELALKLNDRLGNETVKANIYGSMGMVYMNKENYQLALEYFQLAYLINDSLNANCRRAYSGSFLGNTYVELGEEELAKVYLNQAYNDAQECGIRSVICYALWGLATIEFNRGEYRNAEQKFLESYQIAKVYQLKKEVLNVTKSLYPLYVTVGQYKKALKFLEITRQLEDEMFNQEQIKQITSLALTYDFQLELDSIEFARKAELLTLNAQMDNQKNTQYFMVVGLLFSVLFGAVIFRLYRSNLLAKVSLQANNETISKALDERDVLLREVHHRVKNNLQVVSSLLNNQSKFLTDYSAKKAIIDGRNRVLSMALVHEKLFQSEDLTNVDIKEYLEELVITLFKSHNISEDKIKLSSSIDSVVIPVDVTVQLGLIINELVTNSLKHGFPDDMEGFVRISFKKCDDKYQLLISDNGVGISSPEELINSYGLRMVKSIVRGLDGEVSMDLGEETCFQITF